MRGQMMVELIIGMTLIVAAIGGIFLLMVSSLRVTRAVGGEYVATYLAAEGVELAKSLAERDMRNRRPFNQTLRDDPNNIPFNYEIDYDDWNLTRVYNPAAGCCDPRPLLLDEASSRYSYDNGVPTQFIRLIDVRSEGPTSVRISSGVAWTEYGRAERVVLEDVVYDLCVLRCPP